MRLTWFATSMALLVGSLAACSSKSGDFAGLSIQSSSMSAPADGMTAITLTLYAVGADGTTPYNGQVSLSCKNAVTFGGSSSASDTVTLVDGTGTDTVTCNPGANCIGSDTIHGTISSTSAVASSAVTISFSGPGGTTTSSGSTSGSGTTSGSGSGTSSGSGSTSGTTSGDGGMDAGLVAVGGITALGADNPYMGVNYQTNYTKFPVNTFTFQVTDSTGKIAVPGAPVTVSIQTSQPASSPPFVGTLVGAIDGGVDGETLIVLSDTNGKVVAQAQSGQKAGSVTITASVDAGTTVYNAQSSSQVIGTQPSLSHSALSCTPGNLPVYATGNTNLPCETTSSENYATVCTVNLADRFGQVVEVDVALQFYSEAGNFVSASVSTPKFGQTGTGFVPGQASNMLETVGQVPGDVTPLSFEPSYTDLDPMMQRCGQRTYNPRDGLVTVIAVFQGEESFTDLTGAGVYQPGDPFTDMPQPFVDSNDDSVYESGEVCPGSTTAGQCGGPSGAWDANTNLWVEGRILYSGLPGGSIDLASPSPYVSTTDDTTIVFSTTSFSVPEMGSATVGVDFADINLNIPAAVAIVPPSMSETAFGSYGAVITQGPTSLQITFPAPGSASAPGDSLGMSYTPITVCDGGVSQACHLVTHITQFTAGFGTAFKLANSNSMPPGASATVRATEHAGVSSAFADVTGNAH